VYRQARSTQLCGPMLESSSPLGVKTIGSWAMEGHSMSPCRGWSRPWQGKGRLAQRVILTVVWTDTVLHLRIGGTFG